MRKILLAALFTALTGFAFSQGTYIPLETDAYGYINRLDIKYGRILPIEFTSDKGYERSKVARVAETLLLSNLRFNKVEQYQLKYLIDESPEFLDSLHSVVKKALGKKLYTEPASFYSVYAKKKGLFDLHLNPIIGATIGGESGGGGRFVFNRSVGVEVRGNIKRVLSFYFNGTGNDERPPYYVSQVVSPPALLYQSGTYQYQFVPGQSYYKNYSSKLFGFKDGIDYFDARGYVKANILKYINLTFGRDKFFIGDGWRSLILSDFSAPYLFLKFDINIWRFKYENIFAQLTGQYDRGADQLLPVKYMAVHHLTCNAAPWITFGAFETVIYERSQFDFSYLNPIIFYKAVEASLGNPDKVSIGGDLKLNFISHLSIYSQILLNEFNAGHFFSGDGWWANKWAIQLGLKYIDIAPNLDGQIEMNVVRPFTYTADGTDNFTNYNQPLADPLGANFYEIMFNLHYQPLPVLQFNARYFVAKVGGDTMWNGIMTNYGGDILLPNGAGQTTYITQQLHNRIGQGSGGTINYFDLTMTYEPWHNIYFDTDIMYRSFSTLKTPNNPFTSNSTVMFSVGLRLNLARRTYEF